jgi:purine-nucleoside phosphorylase
MNSKISLAVILGSGLGEYIDELPNISVISKDYSGIHKKVIFTSEIEGKKVLFFSGRKHYYEGFPIEEITANISYAARMGIKNIIITNAAGGINENFEIGDMMLLNSQLNMNQKLIFKKSHFPYSSEMYRRIEVNCKKLSIALHEGVYCCTHGPMYETKAEIRMLKKLGCDAVGMSTVPESYAARELGINAAAISVITNLLKENDLTPTSHNEVTRAASIASGKCFALIKSLLMELN